MLLLVINVDDNTSIQLHV